VGFGVSTLSSGIILKLLTILHENDIGGVSVFREINMSRGVKEWLHEFLVSALGTGEHSGSNAGRFTSEKSDPVQIL
jgi:hypothetical protein